MALQEDKIDWKFMDHLSQQLRLIKSLVACSLGRC